MNSRKLTLYLLFSFALSWIIAAVIYLLKINMESITAILLMVVYMYMPALSVVMVQKFIYREPIVKPMNISFRLNIFFLWALLFPAILIFITTGIGFLLPGIDYSPDMSGMIEMFKDKMTPHNIEKMQKMIDMLPFHPVWLFIIQGLIYGSTVNALAAFGEELGWRGFLLNVFRNMKFFRASFLIGVIWGIWHAPIILMGHNYPQHPQWGVLFMIIFCTLFGFLMVYITLKAKSVIAASVMHGSVNSFWGITIILSKGGTDLTSGIAGVAGFITMLVAILLVFIYDTWISKEKIMMKTIQESLP